MHRTAITLSSLIGSAMLLVAPASASQAPGVSAAFASASATGALSQHREARTVKRQNAKSKGVLEFEKEIEDFGLQPAGTELNTKFVFRNTGEETVTITSTRSSCGCTAAVLDTKVFEPGEGSVIDVKYEPRGTGVQTKNITITTDSIEKPTHTLKVSANVVQVLDIQPRTLQFGQILVGESKSVDLTVFSKDPNMTIKDVRVNGSAPLTAEVLEEIPAEVRQGFPGKKRIRVTVPDNLPIGRVHATLAVTAMAAFMPEQAGAEQTEHTENVSVLGRIVGNLQASPSAIRMLPLRPNEEFSYTTRITHRSGEDFELAEDDVKLLRSSIPGVEYTLERFEEGPRTGYILTIKGDAGNHRGAFRGTFAITPEVEGEPPLRINYSGTVRSRR